MRLPRRRSPARRPSARWLALALLAPALLLSRAVLAEGEKAPEGASSKARSATARVVEVAAQDNQVMAHLDHLVNRIGPRLTGSHNIEKAYEWTRGELERFGLSNAHTEVWGQYAVGFDRTGPSTGRVITDAGERPLTFGTFAWTPGTDGPRRGPALLEPRTPDELEAVRSRLKGAWIVSRGRGTTQATRKEREEIAKALDAAGILGRVRSVGGDLILTDGSPEGITMQTLPTRVVVNVTKADSKFLNAALKKGERCELELDVKNAFYAGPVEHKNVIAEIPGTDRADELVIVGGHLDSWDGATGTTDNGTGVATTLEAARLLAKAGVRPRRTIRFILWSGEEQGLLGSAGYVKAHKAELAKISCVLVHDGGTNYVSGLGVTKVMRPVIGDALAGLEALDQDMPFKLETVDTLPYGVGSDHDTFLSLGVPGFFWQQEGRADYDHTHHTQFDTFDAAIPEYQKHSAVTIAAGALAIANLDRLLPRENMLPRPRKMLGVQTAPDLTINGVVPGSRADTAELHEGDRIVSIGGTPVKTLGELRSAVQKAEGEVEVRFLRDDKEQSVKVLFEPEEKKAGERRWF